METKARVRYEIFGALYNLRYKDNEKRYARGMKRLEKTMWMDIPKDVRGLVEDLMIKLEGLEDKGLVSSIEYDMEEFFQGPPPNKDVELAAYAL